MKKIMFNDKYGLTAAVLEGRKTQTRRIIKMNDAYERGNDEYWSAEDIRNWNNSFTSRIENAKKEEKEKCFEYLLSHPRNKLGEVVAVAQSYRDCGGYIKDGKPRWEYISEVIGSKSAGWANKMFVKSELMPYQIRITKVKIERLQDISDEDCLREGIIKGQVGSEATHFMDAYYIPTMPDEPMIKPRIAYAELIDEISGEGTWANNPYVFVYDFELVK